MRVRHIILRTKLLSSETNWRDDDLPPRHAPIYSKSFPIRGGWRWRSARLQCADENYVLWAQCNPRRDKWKAVLAFDRNGEAFVICRFEYHGSHPGLHVHSDCQRSGIEPGSSGMNLLGRFPNNRHYHRRIMPLTENTFWDAAKRFFRVKVQNGPLFDA